MLAVSVATPLGQLVTYLLQVSSAKPQPRTRNGRKLNIFSPHTLKDEH